MLTISTEVWVGRGCWCISRQSSASTAHSYLPRTLANERFLENLEDLFRFPETYVCSLSVRETVSFCGQRNARKINRPLYYVNSAKVGEEKARLSKSGQRASNGSCQDASVPVVSHKHTYKTYLLSQVTNEQTAMIPSAKGMACV
jgi:hypothetical protein